MHFETDMQRDDGSRSVCNSEKDIFGKKLLKVANYIKEMTLTRTKRTFKKWCLERNGEGKSEKQNFCE